MVGSVRLPGRPFRAVASPTPAGWLSASIMVAVETGVKVDDGKVPRSQDGAGASVQQLSQLLLSVSQSLRTVSSKQPVT